MQGRGDGGARYPGISLPLRRRPGIAVRCDVEERAERADRSPVEPSGARHHSEARCQRAGAPCADVASGRRGAGQHLVSPYSGPFGLIQDHPSGGQLFSVGAQDQAPGGDPGSRPHRHRHGAARQHQLQDPQGYAPGVDTRGSGSSGDDLGQNTLGGCHSPKVFDDRNPGEVSDASLCARPETVLPLPSVRAHSEGLRRRVAALRLLRRAPREQGLLGEAEGEGDHAGASVRQLRGEARGFQQLVPEAPVGRIDPVRDDPSPASSDTPSTEEDHQGLPVDGDSSSCEYPRTQPGPVGWCADRHEAPGREGWRQGDEVRRPGGVDFRPHTPLRRGGKSSHFQGGRGTTPGVRVYDPVGHDGNGRDHATPGLEGGGRPTLGPEGERPGQSPPGRRQRQGQRKEVTSSPGGASQGEANHEGQRERPVRSDLGSIQDGPDPETRSSEDSRVTRGDRYKRGRVRRIPTRVGTGATEVLVRRELRPETFRDTTDSTDDTPTGATSDPTYVRGPPAQPAGGPPGDLRRPGAHVTSERACGNGTGRPGIARHFAGNQRRGSVTPDAGARTSLKFVSWNAQTVLTKVAAVVQTVLDDEIDVLTLQEASLTADDTGRTKLNVPGYTTFFASARPGCGHEVATLVKRSLPADVVDLGLDFGRNSVLSVRIQLDSGPVTVHNVHRKPGEPFSVCDVLNRPGRSILLGDLNAHNTLWGPPTRASSTEGRTLADQLDEVPNYVVLNEPVATHIRGGGLDLAIVHARLAPRATWSLHPTLVSDHFGIQVDLIDSEPELPPDFVSRWTLTRADWDKYRDELAKQAALDAYPDTIEGEADQLVAHVTAAADLAIPKSKARNFRKNHWFSDNTVRQRKRAVNRRLRLFRTDRTPANKERLREALAVYRLACDTARHESWSNWATQLNDTTSLRSLWQRIHRVRGVAPRPPIHPDPVAKADELIAGFSARTATDNLSAATQVRLAERHQERAQLVEDAIEAIAPSDVPFSHQELLLALDRPKDSCPGEDNISYSMLRRAPAATHSLLLRLCNNSLRLGRLPSGWKQAAIVPIPKPGKKGEYRPISLLPCASKIMEVMVLNRLRYVAAPLKSNTFGFKRGSGTSDAIATLVNDITDAQATSRPLTAVFVDLEKAFELANQTVVLAALARTGVRGKILAWVRDFLSDRKGTLAYQGARSSVTSFENGTPQGSALSPTLFNYLMDSLNDMVDLPPGIKLLGYADDLVVYNTNGRQGHGGANSALQQVMDRLHDAISDLGLKVSTLKTQAVYFFGRRPKRTLQLSLNGVAIDWVDEFKYLGVVLDRNLRLTRHVEYVTARVRKRLDVMRILAHLSGVTARILKTFYVATVRSVLEYGAHVFGLMSRNSIERLSRLQNAAMRVILGAPKGTGNDAMRSEIDLPPLDVRYEVATATFVERVASNAGHPLHRSVLVSAEQDHDAFRRRRGRTWVFKATESHHKLAMDGRLPVTAPPPRVSPPWAPHPLKVSVHHPFKSKASVPETEVKETAVAHIFSVERVSDHVYYTDGSVTNNKVSAAFVTSGYAKGCRLQDGCSILQAELVAIREALTHAERQGLGRTVVHSDSLAAIQSLRGNPKDNIGLANDILDIASRLPEAPLVNWVPSHVGIPGNEAADRAAARALGLRPSVDLPPSSRLRKGRIRRTAVDLWQTLAENDPKATSQFKWNSRLNHSRRARAALYKIDRGHQKDVYRLRLNCRHRRHFTTGPDCSHCDQTPTRWAIHYLVDCPGTMLIRPRLLLRHLKPEARDLRGWDLAIAILNAQADRGYRDLVELLSVASLQ